VEVKLKRGETQCYFTPLAVAEGVEDDALLPHAAARVRRGNRVGLLYGASAAPEFPLAALASMRAHREIATAEGGVIRYSATSKLDGIDVDLNEVKRLSGEQSNTSIVLGDKAILKLYRRLQPGIHPEIEMGRFLTEVAHFANTPALLGSIEHVAADGTTTALAILQAFVRNQGDAWQLSVDAVKRELDALLLLPESEMPSLSEVFATYRRYATVLGMRTAELHKALATPTADAAFAMEPLGLDDVVAVAADARAMAERAFQALARVMNQVPEAARPSLEALSAKRDACFAAIDALVEPPRGAVKTRIHGDYHLGQVLIVQDDVTIVDFEGEPSRPAIERRSKGCPLRDVAGMLRSFSYMTETAARDVAQRLVEGSSRANAIAASWRRMASDAFLIAYEDAARGSPVWIDDQATRQRLLRLHLFGKAFYEINYEADNRPDWIDIPVQGVISLLEEKDF
jgi:maltose alpha-D-glucosyltransferase/alpha-amylase